VAKRTLLTHRQIFLGLVLTVTIGVTLLALLYPVLNDLLQSPLRIGEVAPYEINAPYSLTYQSDFLTARLQNTAAEMVAPVYSTPDPAIARQQLEHLRTALGYTSSVRADPYASQEQRLTDLAALENIVIDRDTGQAILALSDTRWQIVSQEAIVVLEQVMRGTIRDYQLDDVRRNVPTLVNLNLTVDQAEIVSELATAFVVPNSLYNADLTEAARSQARSGVAPVMVTLAANQTIIQRGQLITDQEYETLEQFNLVQPGGRWQDIVSATMLTILVGVYATFYLRAHLALIEGNSGLRNLSVMVAAFILFLLVARLLIPGHAVIPYLFPIMAFSMTISALFSPELAIVATLPLVVLTTFGMPDALALDIYYLVSSIFGVFALGRARRLTSYFWAAFAIALSGAGIAIVYRLLSPSADWLGLATLAGAAVVSGVASASIALLLHFYSAQFLGTTTGLQLIELSRPDHPLLQFLLRNAPGTYQHSLQLANLVEQAAERIGADGLLARVGALYHDCGKALNPFFFIENQLPGNLNPHDDIDPVDSALTIIRHVSDGLELARKYRLPRRLLDFISEHHGTGKANYQYTQAVKAAGGDDSLVDPEKFRYAGPRPQSRETALLMLADGSEARMRAERPKDEIELRALIASTVQARVDAGQLADTSLTLRDLQEVIDSFTATLRGVYHPRIQYPKPGSEVQTVPVSNTTGPGVKSGNKTPPP
jgi:putative nucleotidyltransferase with HDIG domain